jgi:hypothetical protein
MAMQNYAARDATIRINSYTTVLRREGVPHEVFATYWRDVHGPLCSRVPGLGWYVQNHFNREQDAHLWPEIDGITPIPDYVLDGGVEIGFANAADQSAFKDASPILFSDEQNMFAETLAYDLAEGSRTFVDRWADPVPNGNDGLDRIHLHFSPRQDDTAAFRSFMADELAATLAASPEVLKLRLHLPAPYDNAVPNPPAPNVAHAAPPVRVNLAMMELAFASPMTRRTFYASDLFQSTFPASVTRFVTPPPSLSAASTPTCGTRRSRRLGCAVAGPPSSSSSSVPETRCHPRWRTCCSSERHDDAKWKRRRGRSHRSTVREGSLTAAVAHGWPESAVGICNPRHAAGDPVSAGARAVNRLGVLVMREARISSFSVAPNGALRQ